MTYHQLALFIYFTEAITMKKSKKLLAVPAALLIYKYVVILQTLIP